MTKSLRRSLGVKTKLEAFVQYQVFKSEGEWNYWGNPPDGYFQTSFISIDNDLVVDRQTVGRSFGLTKREMVILELLVKRLKYVQIAEGLKISYSTVEADVKKVRAKMGLKGVIGRLALFQEAVKNDLVSPQIIYTNSIESA